MRNRLMIFIGFFAFLSGLATGQPLVETLSKDEVINLIPKGDGMLGLEEKKNISKLIGMVDSIYPFLCEELFLADHPYAQGYIIAILGKTKKNKEYIRSQIKKFMDIHKEKNPQTGVIFVGVEVLGDIGEPEDIDFLSYFLNVGSDVDRVVAAQSIEKIRKREEARERDVRRLERRSKRGGLENTERVDPRSDGRLPSSSSPADKTQGHLINFWPWMLGALALMAFVWVYWKK